MNDLIMFKNFWYNSDEWENRFDTDNIVIRVVFYVIKLYFCIPLQLQIYKDVISDLNVDISCDKFLTAPVSSGSCIGSITCKVGDSVLLQNSIKLTSSIYKKSVFDYFIYFFKLHKYICV